MNNTFKNTILNAFSKSDFVMNFDSFVKVKYNYPNPKILYPKPFHILLGFLIEYCYAKGYEVIASHKGFKITQHKKGTLISIANGGDRSDAYGQTVYMKQNDATTLINYEHGFRILIRALNGINEPF